MAILFFLKNYAQSEEDKTLPQELSTSKDDKTFPGSLPFEIQNPLPKLCILSTGRFQRFGRPLVSTGLPILLGCCFTPLGGTSHPATCKTWVAS